MVLPAAGGDQLPPPIPVVGKLIVKGKFDFTSVSLAGVGGFVGGVTYV